VTRRTRQAREPAFDNAPGPVLVRTVYERFPITIKGALVLRGGDINPHVARITEAVLARTPPGYAEPVAVEGTPMHVAPKLDLYLPFEAPIADLEPSWYLVRSLLQVDGGMPSTVESRPFSIPWPRSSMAIGSVTPAATVAIGPRSLVVERVDLRSDRVEVLWRPSGWRGAEPVLGLRAGEDELEPVPDRAVAGSPGPDRRRSVWYPAPRGTSSLTLVVGGRSSGRAELTVRLSS
jgi:hypothetical protein